LARATARSRRGGSKFIARCMIAFLMSRSVRKPLGALPPPRRATKLPPLRPIGKTPGGDPLAHAPLPHMARAPEEHRAGKPPSPRMPKQARRVHGSSLNDLFQIFPDLPRPAHPAPRTPARTGLLRRAPRLR
jgi:hypothetical protein